MIDKTYISGFLHYRTDLGDGVRTGVVFSFCRENCKEHCLSYQFLPEHHFTLDTPEKTRYTEEEMIAYLKEEKTLCYTKKLGISFLGAEPLQDPFFCKSVAQKIREEGMDLQVHTCGMCSLSAYDVMDELVDLYVLKLFSLVKTADSKFPDPSFGLNAILHFEKRKYFYRVKIDVMRGLNADLAVDFARFLSDKQYLKSVILDFSLSDFGDEEIFSYKEEFLKRGIALYSL